MKCRVPTVAFWSLVVLACAVPAMAADEIKIDLKDFKFRPPDYVANPDQLFTYNEDEGRMSFYTNGPADASFKVPADGDYEIVCSASGDPAGDDRPTFKVSIDGEQVGDETTLTADDEKDYKLTAPIKAGEHKLTIEFINDTYKEGEYDSNFFLHGVKLAKK